MSTMHGRKADGAPITDEMVETIADEAERGGDVEQLLRVRRGGRPSMGTAAASVESRPAPGRSSTISASVRLDPEIKSDAAPRQLLPQPPLSLRGRIADHQLALTERRFLGPGANMGWRRVHVGGAECGRSATPTRRPSAVSPRLSL